MPLIRKAASGRIVNLSSIVGSLWWTVDANNPSPDVKWLGYAASKAAVNMLTVQLALELKDTPIKVNAVFNRDVAAASVQFGHDIAGAD
ncbi:SDR family NAD(P)-dependent oxidoreductase, partial [Rhizobium ruizarguesonis]